MKYYTIIIVFLFFSFSSRAQETEFNPYNQALKEYITTILDENQNLKLDTVYILQKESVTDNLIKEMTYKNIIISVKITNNKEILKGKIGSVIEILPISATDKKLSIDVIDFGIKIMKRKKINFINSGIGIRYDLKYDCNNNKFYIKKNDAF